LGTLSLLNIDAVSQLFPMNEQQNDDRNSLQDSDDSSLLPHPELRTLVFYMRENDAFHTYEELKHKYMNTRTTSFAEDTIKYFYLNLNKGINIFFHLTYKQYHISDYCYIRRLLIKGSLAAIVGRYANVYMPQRGGGNETHFMLLPHFCYVSLKSHVPTFLTIFLQNAYVSMI
jgi:hypothetical protein